MHDLTKEQKMIMLEKAIDMGAEIDINFHDCKNEEDAETVIKAFQIVFNKKPEADESENIKWFHLDNESPSCNENFEVTAYYK